MGATDRVRLATVNTAGGRDLSTGRIDLTRLAGGVAGLAADVVALQEVDRGLPRSDGADQAGEVARTCGDGARARFAAALRGTPGDPDAPVDRDAGYGNALVTALPVRAWHELPLDASRARLPLPDPGSDRPRLAWHPDEPRVAAAAVVETPLGRLSVVTTHLSFFPPHAARQLRRIRSWAEDLPRPLVLMGDLNLPAVVVSRLVPWRPLVAAPTFPAAGPRVQLDHVLADGLAWPVLGAGAVRVGASDHRGLVVTLGAPG